MDEVVEKRGPIEKTKKGWPVNPFGVVALLIFAVIVIFLIIKPLVTRQNQPSLQEQTVSPGGQISSPAAGQIVKGSTLNLELTVDEPQKVEKVEFWAKTYADGNWQMIGEVNSGPYKINWQIPADFQNKAIAVTTHIVQKDGNTIKDPGGWKEGIILLNQ